MKTLLRQVRRDERGAVALEFAIVLVTVLLPLLAAALFFGRFFWHYTVAEKAAQDGARFLASASATELKAQSPLGGPHIAWAARALVQAELAELSPGSQVPEVYVFCDGGPCLALKTAPLPKTVSIYVAMSVEDPFLSGLHEIFSDGSPPAIQIDATGNPYYVGN